MRSPRPAAVVIACPHCGTRYQVAPDTLGASGRKVACAHCSKAWMANPRDAVPVEPEPEPDTMFSPAEEEGLDRAFAAAEEVQLAQVPASVRQVLGEGEVPPPEVMRTIAEIRAAIAPRPQQAPAVPDRMDVPSRRKTDGAIALRKKRMAEDLPTARLRRVLRVVGLVGLAGMLAGGLLLRTDIVRLVPDLAGLYAAIGLEVNVVGLEFTDVTTLVSRRGGVVLLNVDAAIVGVETRPVVVPPVVVTLLDAAGTPLYEWSVTPRVRDLERGEVIPFSTELPSPPEGVARVRLSFSTGRSPSATPAATAAALEGP